MSARREVNVERPEHSWIPFYRELAEKLANEGWRERQGELVGVLKEMKDQGIPMPSFVDRLIKDIDPFTVFTPFSRRITFESTLEVMREYRSRFGIESKLPDEVPYVPYANNQSLGYFSVYEGMESDIDLLWQMFEIVLSSDPFDEGFERERFIEIFDKCLSIKMIAVSKLTSAFYWINPHRYLHVGTVNEITQRDGARIQIEDGETYLECLLRASELTSRSFPEMNILVYKMQNPSSESPSVWIVRGGRDARAVDEFLTGNYAGFGFFAHFDVSTLRTEDELRKLCEDWDLKQDGIDQVARFLAEIRIGDWVLMPGPRSTVSHYGRVTSDPYHDVNGTHNNRRDIEWSQNTITRAELDLSGYQHTVTHPNQSLQDRFLEIIRNGPLPPSVRPYGIDDMLEDGLFFEGNELERILGRFEDKRNLILQGPPGVGKTFVSKRLAYALMGARADDRIVNVQFHQSYSYEEFVRGYRPTTNDRDELTFELQDGTFLRLCEEAGKEENEGKKFVMIIDEINRGNLSRVFGELLSLIEGDKRGDGFSVELQGGQRFSVPENVYILGTMNLADRSLAGMDYAMRRRFAFVTLKPQFEESVFEDWLRDKQVPGEMIKRINGRMSALNEVISGDASLGRNFAVGHSYFCDIADGGEGDWERWYREIVKTEVQPLLEEYWFDDLGKADGEVQKLLGEQ